MIHEQRNRCCWAAYLFGERQDGVVSKTMQSKMHGKTIVGIMTQLKVIDHHNAAARTCILQAHSRLVSSGSTLNQIGLVPAHQPLQYVPSRLQVTVTVLTRPQL